MANVIEITDFTAPELDVYARLSEGQLLNRAEPEKGMFIAESPRVIERALDAGCVPVSFLSEDRHIEKEAKEILERCGEIPAYVASFDVLTQLTGYKLTRGSSVPCIVQGFGHRRKCVREHAELRCWRAWSILPTWGLSSAQLQHLIWMAFC